MARIATGFSSVRGIFILMCMAALVLSVPTPASAQKGPGGLGGETGGSGGGSRGGSKGSREPKERPKRNEKEPVDPAVSREKLEKMLVTAFTRGTASTPFLASQFDQASTQPQPASAQARRALADALSAPLKGNKLEADSAAALAAPLAAAVNSDGIEPDDLSSKKESLKQALTDAKLTGEQNQAVLDAFDRVIADQQSETIKKVADDLENIQKEGQAGADLAKSLADSLAALADEGSKPDEAELTKLSEHLAKAADAAQLTNKEKAQLAFNFQAIFNNPTATPIEFHALLNEVRSILKAALAKQADIQAVAADLQAIRKSLAAAPPAEPAEPPATAPAEGAEK